MIYKEIFRNDFFIVVDKAPQVLSVPSRDATDARLVLGKVLEMDLRCRIFPVHRLDFEVSGLIMFALTEEAHRVANRWFEKKEVTKTYQALTTAAKGECGPHGFVTDQTYQWRCKILRGKKRAYESPHGKEALTSAKLIAQQAGILIWELNPITGRSHQLRYDLFRHRQPILGDDLYGGSEFKVAGKMQEGIALRAFKLDFSAAPEAKRFLLPEVIQIEGLIA